MGLCDEQHGGGGEGEPGMGFQLGFRNVSDVAVRCEQFEYRRDAMHHRTSLVAHRDEVDSGGPRMSRRLLVGGGRRWAGEGSEWNAGVMGRRMTLNPKP